MKLGDVDKVCPVCDRPTGEPHDAEKHKARDREDYGSREPGDAAEPKEPAKLDWGRRMVLDFQRQRPDLAEAIERAYQEGLQGIPPDAPAELPLAPKVEQAPDLERPRRTFGYRDDD